MANLDKVGLRWVPYTQNTGLPAFYQATLSLPSTSAPLHSFLQVDGWGHGFVLVNGFNIGRFSIWGPQRSMYVPASVLRRGVNTIMAFESDQISPIHDRGGTSEDPPRSMVFSDQQIWK